MRKVNAGPRSSSAAKVVTSFITEAGFIGVARFVRDQHRPFRHRLHHHARRACRYPCSRQLSLHAPASPLLRPGTRRPRRPRRKAVIAMRGCDFRARTFQVLFLRGLRGLRVSCFRCAQLIHDPEAGIHQQRELLVGDHVGRHEVDGVADRPQQHAARERRLEGAQRRNPGPAPSTSNAQIMPGGGSRARADARRAARRIASKRSRAARGWRRSRRRSRRCRARRSAARQASALPVYECECRKPRATSSS